jgi:sulfoxide reductase heme-binding subunit YedZ
MAQTPAARPVWKPQVPKPLVYLVGFAPAAVYFYLGVVNALGADPIAALERALGLWAFRFLLLALAISPLRRFLKIDLMRYRRAIGLLAFYYAALHVVAYIYLDHGFNWSEIVADIIKRPYITIGMLSLSILSLLAITSNSLSIVKLGGAWAKLHRLVYIAAVGAALHFLMLVKSWPIEPLLYAAATIGLLSTRLRRPRSTSRPA